VKRPTVRVWLTVWNTGALAVALIGFGFAVRYTVRVNLYRSIDRDLGQFARHMAEETAMFQLHPELRPQGPPPKEPKPPERPPRRNGRRGGPPGALPPGIYYTNGKPMAPFSRATPWDTDAFAASLAGHEQFLTRQVGGAWCRIVSVPVWGRGRVIGVVQAARPLGDLRQLLHNLSRTLLMLIPLALVMAGLFGLILTSRALSPVRRLSHAAASLGTDDLSRRLPVVGGHEFAELAQTFNRLIGRLEEAFNKLEAANERLRRFTADASHELRTPLTAIKATTSLALSRNRTPEECIEALMVADSAADTMSRIVGDLLTLARSDVGALSLDLKPTAVADVLEQAVEDISVAYPNAQIRIECADPSLSVIGDFQALVRVVTNLLDNAVRHTPPDGEIAVSGRREGDVVRMVVADTGEGIPPEHLPHIGERFYRVDLARSRDHGGAGLGLSICKSLVEAHGGTVQIHSQVGQGTSVAVILPVCGPQAPPDGA